MPPERDPGPAAVGAPSPEVSPPFHGCRLLDGRRRVEDVVTPAVDQAMTLTQNDRFKLSYGRTLRWALLGALGIVALVWWMLPEFQPQPYRLPHDELEVIDARLEAVDMAVESPPVAVIAAPKTVTAAPDDEATVETVPDFEDLLPVPVTAWTPAPPAAVTALAATRAPVVTYRADAEYPEIARQMALEGVVTVKVLVAADGSVRDVALVKGVHPLLDRAAMAAARRCRFAPGLKAGEPTDAWVALPYRFELR